MNNYNKYVILNSIQAIFLIHNPNSPDGHISQQVSLDCVKQRQFMKPKALLTEEKQKPLSTEDKIKEQNRIRQFALRARVVMPKDYKSFCLVAAHLVKNAHRYWDVDKPAEIKEENSTDNNMEHDSASECKEINRKLRTIRTLKRQNRINEQQDVVTKLKETEGSYRDIARKSGISLKTVHLWCSVPKNREHKAISLSKLRQEEFTNFIMQDTVTFSHPCKRYANKRFLIDTWEETYKKYLKQVEFHKYGTIGKSTMRSYKPKNVLLSGNTPLTQCLCDYCENCELMMKALVAAGLKGIPPNKYALMEMSMCDTRTGQFGTNYTFPKHKCVSRECEDCGRRQMKIMIAANNKKLLEDNKVITWHQWRNLEGKSGPKKIEIRKRISTATEEFLNIVNNVSSHLFRANWHRNMFEYMKQNLVPGYVLQVMDFAMNFRNWYQDEVQSAYWTGTQTTIHGTINFFRCTRSHCNEIVTLSLVHISDDMKHDSFLARAAQNMTFQYLVNAGVPLDLILQFCDNCSCQYKSRRPFAELARCALAIIRVFFGEKHGKSHADALFGRLKAFMSYHIKTRHVIVKNAYDFFTYCRDHFQTPHIPDTCQHYRVEFEYIRPSNVKRTQDCDLDTHVPQTQDYYSVRNTPEPLELKFRKVPCLCPSCISEQGECMNKEHADSWKLVKLIPKRGDSKLKHQKRKRPDRHLLNQPVQVHSDSDNQAETEQNVEPVPESGIQEDEETEELPDIELPENMKNSLRERRAQRKRNESEDCNVTDRVTDGVTDEEIEAARSKQKKIRTNTQFSWKNNQEMNEDIENITQEHGDAEIIRICQRSSEFALSGENEIVRTKPPSAKEILSKDIPSWAFWGSILSALASCRDYSELNKLVHDLIIEGLPDMSPRVPAHLIPGVDKLDTVAQKGIPPDGPQDFQAVWTIGDGNCLSRAISKAYFNDDRKYEEI